MSEKILIIRFGALGDVIMTFPYLAFIRFQYPNSHITLLTRPVHGDFMRLCPWVDEIIVDKGKGMDPFRFLRVPRAIVRGNFSIIYNLQESRLGSRRSSRYLFLARSRPSKIPDVPRNFSVDSRWLAQSDIERFKLQKPYVVIVPGCAPRRRPKKSWSPENYGKLCIFLKDHGLQPVICGGKSDIDIAEEILQQCPTATDLTASTNIMEVATVMASAKAVVSNDTGLMHIAIALKKPTVALASNYSKDALCQLFYYPNNMFTEDKHPHVRVLLADKIGDITFEQVIDAFETHAMLSAS